VNVQEASPCLLSDSVEPELHNLFASWEVSNIAFGCEITSRIYLEMTGQKSVGFYAGKDCRDWRTRETEFVNQVCAAGPFERPSLWLCTVGIPQYGPGERPQREVGAAELLVVIESRSPLYLSPMSSPDTNSGKNSGQTASKHCEFKLPFHYQLLSPGNLLLRSSLWTSPRKKGHLIAL